MCGVGYLLKYWIVDFDGFVAVVWMVVGGGIVFDLEVVVWMMGWWCCEDPLVVLMVRECDVLVLMVEGLSN